MAREYNPQVLTANALLDGDVVYHSVSGKWVRDLSAALVFHNSEDAKTALATTDGQQDTIVGAYLFDVNITNGLPTPRHFREDFRATGPSNYFHGKQEVEKLTEKEPTNV